MNKSQATKVIAGPVILQVLPELKSGGVERGTIEIARAGNKAGYKMLVASNGGYLTKQLEDLHVTHIKLSLASKNPFIIFSNIRRIRNIIKEHNVDIIHARSRAPAWSAYFAAKQAGCHFITTFHGVYSHESYIKKLYNSVMVKGEVVIAISDFIRSHIIKHYRVDPANIRVVPRGADIEQFTIDKVSKVRLAKMSSFLNIKQGVPVILLPGRFTRWKGHEFLINALAQIKNEEFICILAGYDEKHKSYYNELDKKIEANKLLRKVIMTGEIQDMPALYGIADIVVSASVGPEAFGRVSIEGQAMERLVVATNHGGSRETVIDGETGWLVTPGDVNRLAEVLTRLLHITPKQRKRITGNARKNIECNFSTKNMVEKTFAVYNEVLTS